MVLCPRCSVHDSRTYPDEAIVFEFVAETFAKTGYVFNRGWHYEGYLDDDGTFRMILLDGILAVGPRVNPAWVCPLTPSAEAMLALVL